MKEKNNVERDELRLRCIGQLPEGEQKTNMLLKFLQFCSDNRNAKSESTGKYRQTKPKRMSTVDLIDENE